MTPKTLVMTVAKLFPHAMADAETVDTWLNTYQSTLGHLNERELEGAWRRTVASITKPFPPLPAEILSHVVWDRQRMAPKPAPEDLGKRSEEETVTLMRTLVKTPLGRHLVGRGLSPWLHEAVQFRKVNGPNDLTADLTAEFEASLARWTKLKQSSASAHVDGAIDVQSLVRARDKRTLERDARWRREIGERSA